MIATIADRARKEGVPVMVVTGDRDAFQLIDPESRVKVMATGRGITDTKIYDHQAVIDRYGIAPELIPDFYGLKGDTSDNIPGVPGIGDKTASELLQRFGSLEEVLAHIDDISGAKRKENLTEHADNARLSKVLATIKLDVPVEIDPVAEAAREPDRSRLREVFREFELRAPLARLEEAFGEGDAAAPAPVAEVTVKARVRAGSLADVAGFERGKEVTVAVVAPETPEGQLVPTDTHWRFGVAAGENVLVGACDGPRGARRRARRPARGRPRRQGARRRAARPRPTTPCWPPTCSSPRGAASRSARSARSAAWPPTSRTRPGADAVVLQALAAWQREQLHERGLEWLMAEVELPLVRVLRDMEVAGVRLNRERLGEVDKRVRDEIHGLEREIWTLADEEFVIGSPQQLGAVLFEKLGLSRKRRGKTGFSTDARVLQAIRDEHEIIPKIERWRELNQLLKTYLDVLPQLTDTESRVHTTFVQAAATTGRLASTNPNMQNVPVRTELGREIRGCFEAAPGNVLISRRLLAGRAADPGPHRRRGGAQGDLRPRRGRAHGDRARWSSARTRAS